MAGAMVSQQFAHVSLQDMQTHGTKGGQYFHMQFLGKGAFGAVFQSADRRSGQTVAVKAICTGNLQTSGLGARLDSAIKEAEHLNQLYHPNIVRFTDLYNYTTFSSTGRELVVCLVTEFCAGGSLDSYLQRSGLLDVRVAMIAMRQLASGLQYLHGKGLTHRDLKPDNVLLDIAGNMKIADFGLAKAAWDIRAAMYVTPMGGLTLGAYMTSRLGTPAFMAPEVYNNHYTEAADVFSLGLLFMCITCSTMFLTRVSVSSSAILPLVKRFGNAMTLGELLHTSPNMRGWSASSLLDVYSLEPMLRHLFDSMMQFSYRSRPSTPQVMDCLQRMILPPSYSTLPAMVPSAQPF